MAPSCHTWHICGWKVASAEFITQTDHLVCMTIVCMYDRQYIPSPSSSSSSSPLPSSPSLLPWRPPPWRCPQSPYKEKTQLSRHYSTSICNSTILQRNVCIMFSTFSTAARSSTTSRVFQIAISMRLLIACKQRQPLLNHSFYELKEQLFYGNSSCNTLGRRDKKGMHCNKTPQIQFDWNACEPPKSNFSSKNSISHKIVSFFVYTLKTCSVFRQNGLQSRLPKYLYPSEKSHGSQK